MFMEDECSQLTSLREHPNIKYGKGFARLNGRWSNSYPGALVMVIFSFNRIIG
ncbi:hypothetical protein KFK09_001808 [Dendrobium nobile]|uniref:Uncharacterized protein n=1 Tax=Dendrobium nobile TaxID=94219 RepID=A0A8T3CBB6_DENNO|nr:hypothetical protein KFK09_001808 [Dendrobium nobile]